MTWLRTLMTISLVSCGGPAPAPPRPAPASAAPACLPRAFASAPIVHFAASEGAATLCYGPYDDGREELPRACVVVDAAGAVIGKRGWAEVAAARAAEPPPPPPPRFTASADARELRVCETATSSCRRLPHGYPPVEFHDEPIAAASDDGTLVFVLDVKPDQDGLGEIWGDTYEVARQQRIARVKLTGPLPGGDAEHQLFSDTSLANEARWVGRKVVVAEWYAGPAGSAVLLDPIRGGWTHLHGYGGSATLLDAHTLLVYDDGPVRFVALDTGEPLAEIVAPGAAPDDADDLASATATARLGGTLLLAYTNPAGVVAIDLARRAGAAPRPIARCD